MTTYASVSDVHLVLNLPDSDTSRDTLITYALNAATNMINNETGRVFSLDSVASSRIYVPSPYEPLLITQDIGSASGITVEMGDITGSSWQAVDTTMYELYPQNAIARGKPITGFNTLAGWGSPWSGWGNLNVRVRVTAKWGWPAVPDEVVQATLLQALRLFKRKDSTEGVLGSVDFGFARISRVDPDVQALISHLVLPGF